MATKTPARSLIMLHAIVLIFGFTGILGKEIQQDSAFIVLLRTAIGAVGIVWSIIGLWVTRQRDDRAITSGSLQKVPK